MVNSIHLVDQLYRNHQQWLYEWLRKKLGHAEQASDLVQDTFVKVLQTRDTLIGIQEPRAYLTTIAKNLMLDQIRRRQIEQAYQEELALIDNVMDSVPSLEEQVMLIQAIDQICAVLAKVSEKAQKAFLWHYLEGRTHKEIAVELDVSTKMVQKYLAQCLVQCYTIQHYAEDMS